MSLTNSIHGAAIPDMRLGRAVTAFFRDTESDLLFEHSSRVYDFGALAGVTHGLKADAGLLYAGAMFRDIGLLPPHSSRDERFGFDGANASKPESDRIA